MKELLVKVVVHDQDDLRDFEDFLKEKYSVLCTGVFQNTRAPIAHGLRAFFTLLKEDKAV